MNFIVDHWYQILFALIVVSAAVIKVTKFCKQSKQEQYEQIKGWLLQAVLLAERDFGSGTGKLKLSTVYSEFCEQMPWLAKVIPFPLFCSYVDDALADMKEILGSNKAIASVVESKGEN